MGALWFWVQGPTLLGVRARRRVARNPNSRYNRGELLSRAQAFQMKRSLDEYLLPWPRTT
ncbi:hypothetical protein D3C77_787220 [compost metagenome]